MSDQSNGFYIKPQAKIFAETYFIIGNNQYKFILPILKKNHKTEDVWRLLPALVNIAFSCEIALKLIYEKETRNIISGHRLYDLFNKISGGSRKLISDNTIKLMNKKISYRDYTEEDFLEDLQISDNVFQNERYAFEYVPGVTILTKKPEFLVSFAQVLLEIIKKI